MIHLLFGEAPVLCVFWCKTKFHINVKRNVIEFAKKKGETHERVTKRARVRSPGVT